MSETETAFLERGTSEWNNAWFMLRVLDGTDVDAVNDGECWQYMGTEKREDIWEHVFRHRVHPITGEREYRRVRPSLTWERGAE